MSSIVIIKQLKKKKTLFICKEMCMEKEKKSVYI